MACLQDCIQGQHETKEMIREKGRQKFEEDSAKAEEFRDMRENLYGKILGVREEIEMARSEGSGVTKSEGPVRSCRKPVQRGTGILLQEG
jgi:hypothetical protein